MFWKMQELYKNELDFIFMLADMKAGLSRKWSKIRIEDNDAKLISEFYCIDREKGMGRGQERGNGALFNLAM